MTGRWISRLAIAAVLAGGGLAAAYVLYGPDSYDVELRLPGRDKVSAVSSQQFNPTARKPIIFATIGDAPTDPAAWPNFRGRELDGVSRDATPLARQWPADGPKAIWKVALGEGYAGPAVLNGKCYLLDYDPPDNWLIRAGEIADFKTFCARLSVPDAPAGRVLQSLNAAGREIVALATSSELADADKTSLVAALNELLANRGMYDWEAFKELKLPPEANRMLEPVTLGGQAKRLRATLSDADVQRLNRLIVEAVAGDSLARSEHGDVLRCFSMADGKELWRFSYPVKIKRNHGMSRTVPAVTEKYIVAIGPKCHVLCLDTATGKSLWGIDLQEQYGTEEPPWYAGQCPLIDGERVILAPGGSSLIIAVDLASGQVVWKTPNPNQWQMTHSSIVPMEVAGRRIYVYCGSGGVVGVDAQTGAILWQTNQWKINIATVPTPVVVGDGRVFLSGGYDAGSAMMQVQAEGTGPAAKFSVRTLWRAGPDVFGATQQTPILYEGYIYGIRPDGQAVCLDLDGKVKWTSGPANRFGIGPFIIADGMMLIVNDSGVLTALAASPDACQQLARAKILVGRESWGPLAIVGGKLLARDMTQMVCLDLRKQ